MKAISELAKLSATLLMIAIFANTIQADNRKVHTGPIVIDLKDATISPGNEDNLKSNIGVVYGTRQCGGPGKLIQWRLERCNTTDSPCRFEVDGVTRRADLEFIPSENINQLGIRVVFLLGDEEAKNVFEGPLDNSSVVGGIQHIIIATGRVTDETIKGKRLTSQYILYRVDNGMIEICAEADFEMV